MIVRSRENVVELVCDHCGTVEQVKNGITGTGFIRKLRPFQRKHDWQCKREAKHVEIIDTALKETDALIKRLATSQEGGNV